MIIGDRYPLVFLRNVSQQRSPPTTSIVSLLLGVVTLIGCGRSALGIASSHREPGHPAWVAPAADGSCPNDTTPCGEGAGVRCYALARDPNNCGRCQHACTPGIACSAGACQQVACSGPVSLAVPVTSGAVPEWPRHTNADMNGDGKLDLVQWSDSGEVRVLSGNGDGTFSAGASYPAWTAAHSYVMDNFVVEGDFNEDGALDLVVAVPGRNDAVDLWPGNGDGTLTPGPLRGGQPASNIFSGDVNRDGHLDVVISGDRADIALLLGRGDGTFAKATQLATGERVIQVVIADWNGDGWPDLLAMGSYLHLLLGTGGGDFAKQQDCGVAADLRENVVADFNGDGKLDLATLLYPVKAVSVMLGDGGCGLSARKDVLTTGIPVHLSAGDVNGDGILDLVEFDVEDTHGHMVTMTGKGDGTFTPSPEVVVSRDAMDVTIGDHNGDGRADVFVGTWAGVEVHANVCK